MEEPEGRETCGVAGDARAVERTVLVERRQHDLLDAAEEDVAEQVVCGPAPEAYLADIRSFADAGFDHVAVHQIGPDQEGFFRFYGRELRPRLDR
jgi:hypothetical protein